MTSLSSTGSFAKKEKEMAAGPDYEDEQPYGRDRRKFPRFKSMYKWDFDPSGNWWEERRSGGAGHMRA